MNPYQILHIKPGATDAEIQQAYRDLVKVWHPDRFGSDPRLQRFADEKLSEVNRAYELLEKMGKVGPRAATDAAPPYAPAATTQTGAPPAMPAHLPLASPMVFLTAVLLGTLLILGVRLYLLLEAPMNALAAIGEDARRRANLGGPSIIDTFQGWNGVLPQGVERLLDSYLAAPAVPRSVDVTRGPAPGRGVESLREQSAPSLIRPGSGEIRVTNRTGEVIGVVLRSARARGTSLRSLPIAPAGKATLDGLGPDVYFLNVSFPGSKRQSLRLGPFMMVEVHSGRGVQADQFDVILKPGE